MIQFRLLISFLPKSLVLSIKIGFQILQCTFQLLHISLTDFDHVQMIFFLSFHHTQLTFKFQNVMLLSCHCLIIAICLQFGLILFKENLLYIIILILHFFFQLLDFSFINLHLLLLMSNSSFFLIDCFLELLISFIQITNMCFISLIKFSHLAQFRTLFQQLISLLQNLCIQSLVLGGHFVFSFLIFTPCVFKFCFHLG